jgi:solute carrier family 25 citrate transporter 1
MTAQKKNPLEHLIAGGCAGLVESSICHPLDTIKTRMQLRRQSSTLEAVRVRARHSLQEPLERIRHSMQEPGRLIRHSLQEPSPSLQSSAASVAATANLHEPGLRLGGSTNSSLGSSKIRVQPSSIGGGTVTAPMGPLGTARRIVQREGFWSLYKGLTAVYTGIIPKMAIRFVSFEQYREWFQLLDNNINTNNKTLPPGIFSPAVTFVAGLCSGLTEAILVVTPAEVCKIRMQGQYHSMADPTKMRQRKYTNVVQTAMTIVREEGPSALYKGVVPTMMRQGCNQAANFSAYQYFKKHVLEYNNRNNDSIPTTELLHWQSLLLGGISGGIGPLINNPLDVVKTRMQKQVITPGGKTPKYRGLVQSCMVIAKEEGTIALWKGITPRLMRIMPGQAITFMTYEAVSSRLHKAGLF